MTGLIKFDSRGFRTDFTLDIIELKKEGVAKVSLRELLRNDNYRSFGLIYFRMILYADDFAILFPIVDQFLSNFNVTHAIYEGSPSRSDVSPLSQSFLKLQE